MEHLRPMISGITSGVGGSPYARLQPSIRSAEGDRPSEAEASPARPAARGQQELTEAERQEVREMQSRDQEVRAHEQAHRSAGGSYVTGGPSYSYETGPDGRRYAVAGEVSIDVSKVPNDPAATIRKAQTVRRAALAPADPSAQDRQVAASATALEQQARTELAREQAAKSGAVEAYRGAGAPEGGDSDRLDLVA